MERLCLRRELGDRATGCRSPHLASDVLTALRASGHHTSVRLTSVTHADLRLLVDGSVHVEVRLVKGEEGRVTVRCGGKVVCVSATRTRSVVTHARDSENHLVPIAHALYLVWCTTGRVPKNLSETAELMATTFRITPVGWESTRVTYVEPNAIRDALRLLVVEATKARDAMA